MAAAAVKTVEEALEALLLLNEEELQTEPSVFLSRNFAKLN